MNTEQINKASMKRIIANGNHPISMYALLAYSKLNAITDDLKAQGIKGGYIDEMRETGLKQIKLDLMNSIENEKETIYKNLEKLSHEYSRNYDAHSTQNRDSVIDAERKFNAMTLKELEKEADNYSRNDSVIDPRIIDALSIAIRNAGDEVLHTTIRTLANEKNYIHPELKTDIGKELLNQLNVLNSCKTGDFPAICKDDSGKQTLFVASLNDLSLEDGNEATE